MQRARDREVAFGRQPVEADRRAPEAVRVARAGRALAEPEGDVERVDLVRGREHAPVSVLGSGASARVGQVLLVDRRATASG